MINVTDNNTISNNSSQLVNSPESFMTKHKLALIAVALLMFGVTLTGLILSKYHQPTLTQPTQPTSEEVSDIQQLPSPTQVPTIANLTITHQPKSIDVLLAPTQNITPSGVSLKLMLNQNLTTTEKNLIIQSIKLDPFWKNSGFRLVVKQFNPQNNGLELALINLQPQPPVIKADNHPLVHLTSSTSLDTKKITLVTSDSIISLKSGQIGLIKLNR